MKDSGRCIVKTFDEFKEYRLAKERLKFLNHYQTQEAFKHIAAVYRVGEQQVKIEIALQNGRSTIVRLVTVDPGKKGKQIVQVSLGTTTFLKAVVTLKAIVKKLMDGTISSWEDKAAINALKTQLVSQ